MYVCVCVDREKEREFIDKRRFSRAVGLTLWEQEDLFSVNGKVGWGGINRNAEGVAALSGRFTSMINDPRG